MKRESERKRIEDSLKAARNMLDELLEAKAAGHELERRAEAVTEIYRVVERARGARIPVDEALWERLARWFETTPADVRTRYYDYRDLADSFEGRAPRNERRGRPRKNK